MAAHNQVLIVGSRNTKKIAIAQNVFNVRNIARYISGNQANAEGIIIKDGHLDTKYYSAQIGLFIDSIKKPTIEGYCDWLKEFEGAEARELRDYLSGIIITCKQSVIESNMEQFTTELIKLSDQLDSEFCSLSPKGDEFQWNGFKVVVGIPEEEDVKLNEDQFLTTGFEFISYESDQESTGKLTEAVQNIRWPQMNLKKQNINHRKVKADDLDVDSFVNALSVNIDRVRKMKETANGIRDDDARRKYANDQAERTMNNLS